MPLFAQFTLTPSAIGRDETLARDQYELRETEEGARGSDAARQSNCHRVARARRPSATEEKSARNLRPTTCEPAVGSTGKKWIFAECEPLRAFARGVEDQLSSPHSKALLPFSNTQTWNHTHWLSGNPTSIGERLPCCHQPQQRQQRN